MDSSHDGLLPGIDYENDIDWDLSSAQFSALETPRFSVNLDGDYSGTSSAANGEDADNSCRVSDALTYGPRFCEIFREYSATQSKPIDVTRHLMALCCEHLIPFISWARQSESRLTSIRTTLFEYDYLRPEVRNGIVMVIMYTFAAVKATKLRGSDMFQTLQDPDNGLGIANKFSLKIYNDPFYYLCYLKTCISALIDAGAIPDNERVGQPRRNKVLVENQEELDAYEQIKQALVSFLDAGDNLNARKMVLQITAYWQQRAKVRLTHSSAVF
jgi:hypothetical protein